MAGRLYPIVDLGLLDDRGWSPVAFAAAVLEARPRWLQLRAKRAGAARTLGLARELLPLCEQAGTELVMNDRPDLAVLAGAPLLHLGQDDIPVDEVRRIFPALGVGLSTHDVAQLDAGLALRPRYVAFGPVFPTGSKERPDPVVGVAALAEAGLRSRAAGVPLVAIGGIDLARAPAIAATGAVAAVIGALLDGPERGAGERARRLAAALEGPATPDLGGGASDREGATA